MGKYDLLVLINNVQFLLLKYSTFNFKKRGQIKLFF